MIRKKTRTKSRGILTVMVIERLAPLLFLALSYGFAAGTGTPAVTTELIEADWLHQDEMRGRGRPIAKRVPAPKVTRESDAAGGVDGIINGKWGFHTQNENKPWWQVDLGSVQPIDRVVVFNRCDAGMGARNSRILLLLSTDGRKFEQVYQHDGTVFLGHADKKPLVVNLDGENARFLRLQHPATSYFHLDEVQVYKVGDKQNIALGRPADQSSTGRWSSGKTAGNVPVVSKAPIAQQIASVVDRGLKLARSQRVLGANIDTHEQTLKEVAQQLETVAGDASGHSLRRLYMKACWAVRKMTLANPLLDFDTILFVKRATAMFPHMSDQYYGWWSRGGGGIYLLKGFKGDSPRVECITKNWPKGNFLRPELSYDGKRVLFAYCKYDPDLSKVPNKVDKEALPEDSFYNIFEMNLDGSGVRQLTRGRYDDFDARYLPDGRIIFLSTRKGIALQAGKDSAEATCDSTQPDSYVRCGGGNHRPVAVFTLHRMDADGGKLMAISAFENFEWTPAVASDGRIIYARWDYIDRFNGHFISLWSTNPDGTNAQLVYGNYTKKPQCIFEARPIPGSTKLIFTATAHHSITGGSLCLLDVHAGNEHERPLTRLTPEVPFPETERNVATYYAGPWPLSEEYFLVGWSDRRLPGHSLLKDDDPNNPKNAMGIYLYDAFGNLELLHRDSAISSMNPIPVRPRPKPPALPDRWEPGEPQEGKFLVQDVYRGLDNYQGSGAYQGLNNVPRGSIKRLRVVGVLPKVQPQMNNPRLGISREETGKFILGTVPVEKDGSAYFGVPSGMSVFFQALNAQGQTVQTMRSLTYVQPGQTLGCVGCHESRHATPGIARAPQALLSDPAKLRPDPPGTWPLRFDTLVQPVLDKHCVSCHNPDSKAPEAAKLDLSAAKSYDNLLSFGGNDLHNLVRERDRSLAGVSPSLKSKLMAMLTDVRLHHEVSLSADDLYRLTVWMDTYGHLQGAFSFEQEEQLRKFRREIEHLLEE